MPRIGFAVHFVKGDGGDVAQIDDVFFLLLDNDIFDVAKGLKFPKDAHVSSVAIDKKVAAGNGHVFVLDGPSDIPEGDIQGFHLLIVHHDANLFVINAADVHGSDGRQILNFFLEVLGVVLELVARVFTRKIDVHNRQQFTDVEVKNVGVSRQVVREVGAGARGIHLVFHLAQRLGHLDIEIKLHLNGRISLDGRRRNLVHSGNAVDFLLEWTRDQTLNVHR